MEVILCVGLAFLFYKWAEGKKRGKRKITGQNKSSAGYHWLDNYPGDNASNIEIIESHLEDKLTNCQYKKDRKRHKDCQDYSFINKKKKILKVRVDEKNKKILSMFNPFHCRDGNALFIDHDPETNTYDPKEDKYENLRSRKESTPWHEEKGAGDVDGVKRTSWADENSTLRQKVLNHWNLSIFNEPGYKNISEEDLKE
jgi:hypothetical protein